MARRHSGRWVAILALCLATALPAALAKGAGFHGQTVSDGTFARAFNLRDDQGRGRDLSAYRGKLVLLFFGYAQCPDVCPTELQRISRVIDGLGADARHVAGVFVTLDPLRDDAAMLKSYVAAFHPSLVALRGSEASTRELAKSFRVFYRQVPGSAPGRYSIDHSTYIYVLDRSGTLRLRFTPDLDIAAMRADLQALLRE